MQTINLFPTLVGIDTYSEHQVFKKIFFEQLRLYTRQDGVTGEASGFVDLQLNQQFEHFFKYVSSVANQYIRTLVGSDDVWDLWLVKSWYNNFAVPRHDHSDSHLSFTYYVNVPEGLDQPLHFVTPDENLNDLTKGMFLGELNKPLAFERNQYNCASAAFPAIEGMLNVFPSRLQHFVEAPTRLPISEDPLDCRVSIAGDFVLTFKQTTPRSMGLQPVSNWRTFC